MSNASIGYNFFVGSDAKEFTTTPKVLGSGLCDWSFNYSLTPFWILNPLYDQIGLSFPIGLRFTKYRFSDNLKFEIVNENPEISIDNDPTHVYNRSFFNYDGSKLVTGYWRVPILVYFPVQKWFGGQEDNYGIFGTFFYERYAFTYHKSRYSVDNIRIIDFTTNKKLKDFGFNKDKIGVSGGLKLKRVVFFAQYVITPFFDESVGKNVNEMRMGVIFMPQSYETSLLDFIFKVLFDPGSLFI